MDAKITEEKQQTIKGGNSTLGRDFEDFFPRTGNLGNDVVPGGPFRRFWESKYGKIVPYKI